MGNSHRYDLIREDDETKEEPQNERIPTTTPTTTPWWKITLGTFVATSAILGVILLATRGSFTTKSSEAAAVASATPSSTLSSAPLTIPTTSVDSVDDKDKDPDSLEGVILDCAHSPEEARAKGCIYDVMMQDWVPEPCYDDALTQRYLAEGNWTWYADGDGKRIISDEEMAKGEHGEAWMSSSYHQAHCIFSWDKTVRAMRNNRPISQELLSYDHVLHCSHQTLNGEGVGEGVGVRAPTNYAKCALYDTWKNNWIPDKHSSTTD